MAIEPYVYQGDRVLRAAAILFAVGSAVHTFDHIRRGATSVTTQLFWTGNVATALSWLVILAVLFRHRLAPLLAATSGFPLALGFAASHLLPHWSVLSDSFVDHHVSPFSLGAAIGEIVGAVALGAAGLYVLRKEGLDAVVGPRPVTQPAR